MPTSRDESFLPLAPGAVPPNERPDYRVTVMAQAENVQSFRPLGQAGAAFSSAHGPAHEPRVTVQHEGDRVSSIQIQCTCGQIIELACSYEPAPVLKPEPVVRIEPTAAPQPAPPPVATMAPSAPPAFASPQTTPSPVHEPQASPAAKPTLKKPAAKGR
jgi:hypothetical protein